MQLSLSRPIVFFDIEATGLNVATDRIVELCYIKLFPDYHEEVKTLRSLGYEVIKLPSEYRLF